MNHLLKSGWSLFGLGRRLLYLQPSCSHSVLSRQLSHLEATTSHDRQTSPMPGSVARYNTWNEGAWHYPKRVFKLPPAVAAIVKQRIEKAKQEKALKPAYSPPDPVPRLISPRSRRVGCIAVKAGMTQAWDEYGARVPLTVLFVDDCQARHAMQPTCHAGDDGFRLQVVGLKTQDEHGYWALRVGAGCRKQKALSPSAAGFFLAQGVPFKHEIGEFEVSEDAMLPVGTSIYASHFAAGQNIDITGYTKYKGFQGVMKRWGFKGLPASHGVSLAHRHPGSIGNRKDPGRVWKGKKLPGHMGDEKRTVHNCLLYKVDPQRNLLYVRGQVPGPAGEFVYVRDAISIRRDVKITWQLPFPTFFGDPSTQPATVYKNPKDPYRPFSEDADYFPIKWKKGD